MSPKQRAELAALAKVPDTAIDVRGIPEVTNWNAAEVGKFYRPRKQVVTIRLDADILAWFKARSLKYQTTVNQVLRDHVIKSAGVSTARSQKRRSQRRKLASG
jgi:uncharacterized protein (DUF4415 family)